MGTLHVWTAEDEEWVVAESAEDACAVYCEHTGLERDTSADGEDSDWGTRPKHWQELPDDKRLQWGEECQENHREGIACPRGCSDSFIIRTNETCAEIVAKSGRAYLGSSNW